MLCTCVLSNSWSLLSAAIVYWRLSQRLPVNNISSDSLAMINIFNSNSRRRDVIEGIYGGCVKLSKT